MTRWTRIFVGVENSATGKKEMVQTKKLIVRAVSKEKKLASAAAGEDGKPEAVRTPLYTLLIASTFRVQQLTSHETAQGV